MRRRRPAFSIPVNPPMSDLNITPLIDVMLVLLIMFLVTIPVATHKVAVDLPQGRPPAHKPEPAIHRIDLTADGALLWDGAPLSQAALPARLAGLRAEPNGELHLRADGAALYADYDRVLAMIKGAGIERLGLVGNEAFARF